MTSEALSSGTPPRSFTAFIGSRRLAAGAPGEVALVVKRALERGDAGSILVFDDAEGRAVDLDLRGTDAEIAARFEKPEPEPEPRGRGRPKLGVMPREVTLLPRHWDWLAAQPGGASVALRRLVDAARRSNADEDIRRAARDAAYHFMAAMAGDLPGFEEACRALFAGDEARLLAQAADWPKDVRDHAFHILHGGAAR
ncbi:MAG: DUF2239 family protein [Caulobacteraceae bacterium]|nr:DUF2239 family protein [Caulobacteraceae bacterium]